MAPSAASSGDNTAVDESAVHDRVSMLSLRADGTPDQHSPVLIGDPEVARKAAERQFSEQAVSAVDDAKRAETIDTGSDVKAKQDPSIAKLDKELTAAEEAGKKRAAAVVKELHPDA